MSNFSRVASAVFAGSLVLVVSGTANAQMPNYDQLSEACQGLYGTYVNAYNDYVAYYNQLHSQYPDGNSPPDTAAILGQKIDAMYAAQDAFVNVGCGPIDAFRGQKAKAPHPKKINLKYKR